MEQLANNPITILDGAISNSATSITVDSTVGFPLDGNYSIRIESELLRVSAVVGNVFTVSRGSEGTAAVSHPDDSIVSVVITSDVMANLFAEMHQMGTAASRPTVAREGSIYSATDMEYRWRYSGTNWDLIHPVYVPYSRRMDLSSWTAINQGTSVWTNTHGIVRIQLPTVGSALRGFIKTLPTPPFVANLIVGTRPITESKTHIGIMFYDSVSGKLSSSNVLTGDDSPHISNPQWTDFTTIASPGTERRLTSANAMYVRLSDDNTNWAMSFSVDGVNYVTVASVARNTFLTPTNIGVHVARNTITGHTHHFEMFGYWET